MKAKALVEECQATKVESRVPADITFPKHQTSPTHRALVKVPSIIAEMNEDRMTNDGSLLMDRIFEEDPAMERLQCEAYTTFMIIWKDSLMALQCQMDLGMSQDLPHFYPWKSRCLSLHR